MPKLGLILASDAQSIERNFQKIDAVAQQTIDIDSGLESVTGMAVINTKLTRVDRCVAGFDTTVNAGACFILSFAGPNINQITIEVLDSALVTSVTVVDISWIAVGETNLG